MWMLQLPNVTSHDVTVQHLAFYTRGQRRKFMMSLPTLIHRHSTSVVTYNNYFAGRHEPTHPMYDTPESLDRIRAELHEYAAQIESMYRDFQLKLSDASVSVHPPRYKRPFSHSKRPLH